MKIVAILLLCILLIASSATTVDEFSSSGGMMCVTGFCQIDDNSTNMGKLIDCSDNGPYGVYCIQPKPGEICKFANNKVLCDCYRPNKQC